MKRTIITLAAVAALGMASVVSAQDEPVTSRPLDPGWNLSGIWGVDTPDEYEAAEEPCPDGYYTSAIWSWDAPTQSWSAWFADGPSDLDEFDRLEGYAIYCNAE